MSSKNNAETLKQIRYWDAGAPAYRWNEMAASLVTTKDFVTFLRTPTAWMNMAIFDATVIAWKSKYKHQRKRPSQIDPAIKIFVEVPATPSYPCEHTVTASAAATVLAYFFPTSADSILALAKQASQSPSKGRRAVSY